MSNIDILADLRSIGCDVSVNEPMSRYTSFKIGGPAEYLARVTTENQLAQVLRYVSTNELAYRILGFGTNMLVPDAGLPGVTVKLEGEFLSVGLVDECTIAAGAGVSLSALCKFALENSLTGLEFAYGIPGSVGGAAFMNAGAYGGEVKNAILSCECMDEQGNKLVLTNEQCAFAYRSSVFSGGGLIVTKVSFRLEKGDADEINAFMEDVMQRRRDKQPLNMPSAGSVFKRPVGYFAGGLIEQCGLKGASVGGAQVSEKHAGFIVNTGGATCQDVLDLVALIQKTVLENTGVELECEIRTMK